MAEYKFDFSSVIQGFDPNTANLSDIIQLIDNLSLDEIVGDYLHWLIRLMQRHICIVAESLLTEIQER